MTTKELFEKYVYEVCKTCKNRCKEFTLCNITIKEDGSKKKAKCDYYEERVQQWK